MSTQVEILQKRLVIDHKKCAFVSALSTQWTLIIGPSDGSVKMKDQRWSSWGILFPCGVLLCESPALTLPLQTNCLVHNSDSNSDKNESVPVQVQRPFRVLATATRFSFSNSFIINLRTFCYDFGF